MAAVVRPVCYVANDSLLHQTIPVNVMVSHSHAGENLHLIFKQPDELIKDPPSLPEYIRNKKSW
jgi:hypothetical protein